MTAQGFAWTHAELGRPLAIGHKGADALVPGNTIASIERAVSEGVDAVEFDFLQAADGRLMVAHDQHVLDQNPSAPTLVEVLDRFAQTDMQRVGLFLDVKTPGHEGLLLDLLAERELTWRTTICTHEIQTLKALHRSPSSVRASWSAPRLKHDYRQLPLVGLLAKMALPAVRHRTATILAKALEENFVQAVTAHFALVDEGFAKRIKSAGELHVWTVDDRLKVAELEGFRVDGVISNDPRILNKT